jgi:hypothetical protein
MVRETQRRNHWEGHGVDGKDNIIIDPKEIGS